VFSVGVEFCVGIMLESIVEIGGVGVFYGVAFFFFSDAESVDDYKECCVHMLYYCVVFIWFSEG